MVKNSRHSKMSFELKLCVVGMIKQRLVFSYIGAFIRFRHLGQNGFGRIGELLTYQHTLTICNRITNPASPIKNLQEVCTECFFNLILITYQSLIYLLSTDFTGEHFNATEWVELFVQSGAKYVVLTSKHREYKLLSFLFFKF